MRLWHKSILTVLPDMQMRALWRECVCIAVNIVANDTPNHMLVNKIMDYDMAHFNTYIYLVYSEMKRRGYNVRKDSVDKINKLIGDNPCMVDFDRLYANWHNDRYLKQCYYNLQEKFDCNGIPVAEWEKFRNKVVEILGESIDD